MSKLILIAGGTGAGKTTFANKLLFNKKVNYYGLTKYQTTPQSKKQYIFDINNEYLLPEDFTIQPFFRHTKADQKYFISVIKKLTGFNILFEDASGFLRGKQSAELIRLIVARRHQQNNFIILFHSINRIPPELLEYCNLLIIFKTGDNLKDVENKFNNPKINNAFSEVSASKNKYFYKIVETL